MWSRRNLLRSLARAGALGALPGVLPGCGFRPLYGSQNPTSTGDTVDKTMAGIRIEPIRNRLGQQLHNALRDQFNPLGQPQAATYRLAVNLVERRYGALSQSNLSASRRDVELTAFYILTDTAGNVVLRDRSQIITGFDEFDDPLNDIVAGEHAEQRGTLQLAEMIRTRLAVLLTQGTSGTAATPAPATTPQ